MGYRELTEAEKAEIANAEREIDHYRAGALLAQMRIDNIKARPQMEYAARLAAEPLEF